MSTRARSVSGYLKAASRFLHLAAGARAEDEDERAEEERDEEHEEDEASEEESAPEEKKGKKGKKAKTASEERDEDAAAEDDMDDEDEARAEEDEDESAKRKKALCVIRAHKEGRALERARWAAVMSSKAAAGRIPLACSLLTDTSMSAEKICAALLASPAEGRSAGLAARMAAVERPDVGSGPAAGASDPNTPKGRAAAMIAAYNKASGRAADAR